MLWSSNSQCLWQPADALEGWDHGVLEDVLDARDRDVEALEVSLIEDGEP